MTNSSRNIPAMLMLALVVTLAFASCDQKSTGSGNTSEPKRHPHTEAMVRMVRSMEQAGYRPTNSVARNKSFDQDPIAWLGPWHIAAPSSDPYQTEWRLTLYSGHQERQNHSFVSVECDARFNEQLIATLIREWAERAPVGLPSEVVEDGRGRVQDAVQEFNRQRSAKPSRLHSLKSEPFVSDEYELRVEFHDVQGFVDSYGVQPDHSRAILYFTFVPEDSSSGSTERGE